MCVLSRSVVSDFCDRTDCSPPGSSVHGGSPGKDTGVGCYFLLQQIFMLCYWLHESNPSLLHCRQILYQLSHEGGLQLFFKCYHIVFVF